jgi:outer membrane protein assembly factor BamB
MTPGATALTTAAARRRGHVFIGQTAADSRQMADDHIAASAADGWRAETITETPDGRVIVAMTKDPDA